MRAACPVHLLLYLIVLIIFGEGQSCIDRRIWSMHSEVWFLMEITGSKQKKSRALVPVLLRGRWCLIISIINWVSLNHGSVSPYFKERFGHCRNELPRTQVSKKADSVWLRNYKYSPDVLRVALRLARKRMIPFGSGTTSSRQTSCEQLATQLAH
jgi:hypothetical protein